MATSYVERLARIPLALARVKEMPDDEMRLDYLAEELGAPVDELRRDLMLFYVAEPDAFFGLERPYSIEFVDPDVDDDEVDPHTAPIVRVVGRPDLGVENLTSGELALIYTAGRTLLEAEPDNDALRDALEVIAVAMTGDPQQAQDLSAPEGADWNSLLPLFRQAREQQRQMRIVYSSSWSPRVTERLIEPYHVIHTKHGWEIDAGPIADDFDARTYLLSNVREAELLDDTFALPSNVDAVIERHRATTIVRMQIANHARWATDIYAESATVVDEDESNVTLDLALLPPLERRVGLITLASGPETRVLTHAAEFASAGPRLAEALFRHHGN